MSIDTQQLRRLLADDLSTGPESVLDACVIAHRARRVRRRRWAVTSGAVLVVAAAGATVGASDALRSHQETAPPAATVQGVSTDLENGPPKDFVAAGDYAVSAIVTFSRETLDDGSEVLHRRWAVYDPATSGYLPTDWSWLDVAPGLEKAAVLEGDLPTDRLGILDLRTHRVDWVELEYPVAGLAWSPDGTTVLATAYSTTPDLLLGSGDGPGATAGPRTGFFLVDAERRTSAYHPLPGLGGLQPGDVPSNMNARQDFGWSLDGSTIWGPTDSQPDRVFYDLAGQLAEGDPSAYISYTALSAASPDGGLVIGKQSGLPTNVVNRDGEVVGEQEALQLLAWADDDHLVALGGCVRPCQGKAEFRNGLVLVAADGSGSQPLSVSRKGDGLGAWDWVLTRR